MTETEQAVEAFTQGFNCSQAVLSAFSPALGLDRDAALKLSCAFGAGMGRTCQTCGAVTGAYMAIGMKHGRDRLEDPDKRDKTYSLVNEFARRFKAKHKSVNCRDLLGCDLGDPAGAKKASDEKLFRTLCPEFVRTAAEILEEIL